MPYNLLLKEAHRLIDEMPEDKLVYFVKTIQNEKKRTLEATDNSVLEFVQKYKGSIRRNINEKAELADYRNAKYARAD